MAQKKTNAIRILDTEKVSYEILTYDSNDGKIDGISVAEKIGKDPAIVFKTLVAAGSSKSVYVFMIPVEAELDLKKAARICGEKKVEMAAVKDIQKLTGYIRGGCSPIGMRKQYPSFIDDCSSSMEKIIISGGKIGIQLYLSTKDLCRVTKAISASLII